METGEQTNIHAAWLADRKWYIVLGLVSKPMFKPTMMQQALGAVKDSGGWSSVKIVGPFETPEKAKEWMKDQNHKGLLVLAEEL